VLIGLEPKHVEFINITTSVEHDELLIQ